jgi:hypothetical protein
MAQLAPEVCDQRATGAQAITDCLGSAIDVKHDHD